MFYEHPWMFQREKVSPIGNDDRPTLRQRLTKRLKTRLQWRTISVNEQDRGLNLANHLQCKA
jgi:hypothetical protein